MCSPLNGYFCQLVVAISALKRYDHLRLHACDFANYARRCTQANRVTIPQCMWIGQSWNSCYWRLTVNIKCWVVLCCVSFLIVLSNLEIHNTTIHAVLLPLSFLQQLTSLSLSLSALRTVLTPVQFLVSQSNLSDPAAASFLSAHVKRLKVQSPGDDI